MITDEQVDDALDFLRESLEQVAKAKAQRYFLEEYRKSLKSIIMKEHQDKPVSAQEREAYADPRYITHLTGIKEAIKVDEALRLRRIHSEAVIEAWRTYNANIRSMKL